MTTIRPTIIGADPLTGALPPSPSLASECEVPCPSCGAEANATCVTKDGRPNRIPHNPRRHAAQQVWAERAASEQAALNVPVGASGDVLPAVTRQALPEALSAATGALVAGIDVEALDAATRTLGPALKDAVRERVRLVRADRPPVVTDADVFPLVRQLTAAEDVLRRIGRAWTGAADECVSIAGEELLTAKGEQDGIPQGRLIVPDGTGQEIVVKAKTQRAPDTYDAAGIVGVIADAAVRAEQVCITSEAADAPVSLFTAEEAAGMARLACTQLLEVLTSPRFASTKVDALARTLAAAGHDTDAGVLQQARIRGAQSWNGATEVVREEAKRRRR
jgi:hypothetical protein